MELNKTPIDFDIFSDILLMCCLDDKVEVKVSSKKLKFVTRSILFPLVFNFG